MAYTRLSNMVKYSKPKSRHLRLTEDIIKSHIKMFGNTQKGAHNLDLWIIFKNEIYKEWRMYKPREYSYEKVKNIMVQNGWTIEN